MTKTWFGVSLEPSCSCLRRHASEIPHFSLFCTTPLLCSTFHRGDETSLEAGIRVQIHSQDEPPYIHQLGFGVSPGFQTFVSCQEQRVGPLHHSSLHRLQPFGRAGLDGGLINLCVLSWPTCPSPGGTAAPAARRSTQDMTHTASAPAGCSARPTKSSECATVGWYTCPVRSRTRAQPHRCCRGTEYLTHTGGVSSWPWLLIFVIDSYIDIKVVILFFLNN